MEKLNEERAIAGRIDVLPRPSPDADFYKSVMELGFNKFPLRRENYRKYQQAARLCSLDYMPIMLDIENVSRCNYHCAMCQVSSWPNRQRAPDMSFDDFRRLLDSQHGLIEIKLQGMGEPLLGEYYFEMIKYARDSYLWVRSSSNASLLHLNDNYKRIIDSDICELQVSIDGATPEVYKKIRRGGELKKVAENSIMLNRYCEKFDRLFTRMWVVVQRDNFSELGSFVKFAFELGFKRLTFSLDLNDWGQVKWRNINDCVDMHRQFDFSLAKHLVALGNEHKIDVTFWFIDQKYDFRDAAKLCPWPFSRAYISSDMRIVPCCMISNPEVLNFGDAKNFTAEWDSAGYKRFRKSHIEGRLPQCCRSCYGE